MRWSSRVSSTTTSQPEKSAWFLLPARAIVFVPSSGKSSTSSRAAAAGSMTAGSGS